MHICDLIRNQETYRADAGQTVLDVAKAMVARNIGAVPVLRDGVLVGIFSERDLMKRVVVEGRQADSTRVAEVMTSDPLVVSGGDSGELHAPDAAPRLSPSTHLRWQTTTRTGFRCVISCCTISMKRITKSE